MGESKKKGKQCFDVPLLHYLEVVRWNYISVKTGDIKC